MEIVMWKYMIPVSVLAASLVYTGCNVSDNDVAQEKPSPAVVNGAAPAFLFLQDPSDNENIFDKIEVPFLRTLVQRFKDQGKADSLRAITSTYDLNTGMMLENAKRSPEISRLLKNGTTLSMSSSSEEGAPAGVTVLAKKADGETIPSNEYGFRYRVYSQDHEWSNYTDRGSAGWENKRLEAIQWSTAGVQGKGHVQSYGDTDWKNPGDVLGTTAISKRLEAIWFRTTSEGIGFIQYRVSFYPNRWRGIIEGYVKWEDWAYEGQMAGSTGQGQTVDEVGIFRMKFGNGNACSEPGQGQCQGV
jgi:hypothetical protein